MTTYTIGASVSDFPLGKFHPNVNKDPYQSHCALCGKRVGETPKLMRFDDNGRIDPSANNDTGYLFAIGNECAKQFATDAFANN